MCTPSVSTWISAARAITGISRHSPGLPDPARRNERNRLSLQGSVEGIGTTTQKSPQSCRILDGEQRRNRGGNMQAFSFISLLGLESSLLAPESSVFAAGKIPAPVHGN